MASRRKSNAEEKEMAHTGLTADAPPPAAPMKVTVDELALRTLYERMLKSRLSLDAIDAARNGSSARNEAMLATTIDLHNGDAVSLAQEGPLVASTLTDAIHHLPSHLGLAAGVALAYKQQGEHHVVLSIAGASIFKLGSSHEALTYASAEKLPLIVVVDCQTADDPDALDTKAAAYGIPSITVDATDAVALYRVSREAVERARSGRGPTIIHCQTFEPAADPVARLERYLDKHGWRSSG